MQYTIPYVTFPVQEPGMTRICAIANQKGGVGKTTFSTQFAYYLSGELSKRVLLVDMDPQGNASSTLTHHQNDYPEEATKTHDLIMGPVDEIVPITIAADDEDESGFRLDLIYTPENHRELVLTGYESGHGRSAQESEIAMLNSIAKNFRENIERIQDQYDYIILDCPPLILTLMTAALITASRVICPVTLPSYTRPSLLGITHTIYDIQASNPNLKLLGIVINNYDQSAAEREVLEEVREAFGETVLHNVIRHRAPIGRASRCGNPIALERGASIAAGEMYAVFEELMNRWDSV